MATTSRTRTPTSTAPQADVRLRAPRPASAYPTRRRPKLILAGVPLVALSAWGAAALYNSAGERRDVVQLARGVDRYDTIDRSDLTLSRVAADGQVDLIGGARLDEIVGRTAAVPLTEGSLLAEKMLVPEGQRVIAPDQEVVGVLLGPGSAPVGLRSGEDVRVVVRPPANLQPGENTEPLVVDGAWIAEVGEATSAGDRPISIVVPSPAAPTVAAAASEKRVAVIVVQR
jgi:SAF domain